MSVFTVTVKRADGKKITVEQVEAKDVWQARTMVWFQMPKAWADGQPVDYTITEDFI